MSERHAKLLIEDMLEAIGKIERFTEGITYESFSANDEKADAVLRNLEVIGEAANRLPEEIYQKYSEIPWHRVIGLRHRIIHNYFGISHKIIWEIVSNRIPELKEQLNVILINL